jgi:hypothetical protein
MSKKWKHGKLKENATSNWSSPLVWWVRECEANSKIKKLRQELSEMTAYADKLAAGFPEGMLPKDIEVLREANAKLAEEASEYRGLLIELYNDINVIHSGKAVSKLNKLFRDENYN